MSDILTGNVVVITGGAGRIGHAFCTAVAKEGGTAVVADAAGDAAEKLASEIRAAHGAEAAIALTVDITRASDIDCAIEEIHRRFGRIDAVVNNAYPRNANYGARFENVTYADFSQNVSLHLGGYFITAQRFASYFLKQRRGNIVFMASIYGVAAPRFEIYSGTSMTMPVEYSVIKAGVLHLTRYLAQYYKPHGIRVNAISPGGVFADQPQEFFNKYVEHSAGARMLEPADLNGALLFLLSSSSSHMTGQNLIVDDGWTL
jgi:NAD(P)-dependent dehydrogenase (short-subunit alcohol dehydrogenase family)